MYRVEEFSVSRHMPRQLLRFVPDCTAALTIDQSVKPMPIITPRKQNIPTEE
jgi:hypothetical protein